MRPNMRMRPKMRPSRIITPFVKFKNQLATIALVIDMGILAWLSYDFSRIYRGTHPALSRTLADAGIWPPPPQILPARESATRDGDDKKEADMRWLSISGVPVPASFDAMTAFLRRRG